MWVHLQHVLLVVRLQAEVRHRPGALLVEGLQGEGPPQHEEVQVEVGHQPGGPQENLQEEGHPTNRDPRPVGMVTPQVKLSTSGITGKRPGQPGFVSRGGGSSRGSSHS